MTPVQPWECPRCHAINAGWVPRCECKPAQLTSFPGGAMTTLDFCGSKTTPHIWELHSDSAGQREQCGRCGRVRGRGE